MMSSGLLEPPIPTRDHLRELARRARQQIDQLDAALGAVHKRSELLGVIGIAAHLQGDVRSLTEAIGRAGSAGGAP